MKERGKGGTRKAKKSRGSFGWLRNLCVNIRWILKDLDRPYFGDLDILTVEIHTALVV
jgi:hypothetical protein